MNTKILITGSSGYVGYVLSKYFSEKNIPVIGLDISSNTAWKGNAFFKFYKCNVTNRKELKKIFTREQPTHIIHLAFLMDPLQDKKKNYEIDVVGSMHVFEVSNQIKAVQQFIQFSSTSAYGAWPDNEIWIKETQKLRPRDYRYGIHKKEVEERFLKFKKRKNLKLVILRMCTAIGSSYHKKGGVVSILANSPALIKFNNRYCEVQFLHEEDLNYLIKKIIEDNEIEGIYNLAPDSYATIKELVPDKFFIPIPLFFMRWIIGILWKIKLVSLMPAAMTLSTYGIVANPEKIKKRYDYKFKYDTKMAFLKTVKERKILGSL